MTENTDQTISDHEHFLRGGIIAKWHGNILLFSLSKNSSWETRNVIKPNGNKRIRIDTVFPIVFTFKSNNNMSNCSYFFSCF